MQRDLFLRRGAVRYETNAKLKTHWSAAMVVGRERKNENLKSKFTASSRASGWPLFVDGRRNSKVRKLNKVSIQLRIASHRSSQVAVRRTSVLFSFVEAAQRKVFFSFFMRPSWPLRDFPTLFAEKIIKSTAISEPTPIDGGRKLCNYETDSWRTH